MKKGKRIVKTKLNMRDNKILCTIVNNYSSGFYLIKIEENYGNKFELGEELLVNYKLIELITEKEWKILINDIASKTENKSSIKKTIQYPKKKTVRKYRKTNLK